MKKLIQKIGLLVIAVMASMAVNAQSTIEVSITTIAGTQVLTNNGTPYDVTSYGDAVQNLFPLTVKIENKGTSTLTLNQVSGKYINLSGTGAADFTIDESGTSASIAAGSSTTFTVDISSGATNGTGKIVTLNISSNDPVNGTFAGSIKYTFTNKTSTAIAKASDIGLSLYPNPSNDGHMFVSADNINVERVVVSNVSGQTEEFASKEFTTALKGLLLVRVYTDKGVVAEKIIIKE
ncbi:MAG: T9SS type A sorting domain-containing protein [Cytophaga sp.]|uniref:T9SS type A sorting domain-containing protein n=1 Tax=Cytophaga sp. TaxID=29535 RepID=UPI003F813243